MREARDAFAGTVAAWSKVEIIRFGPISQDHRFERLFFWPDPKGLGLKQIQDALAKQEVTVTEPDEIAGKSVALQGLPALEYLLYGDDGNLPKEERDFRCRFGLAVATNVDRIAKSVVEGWREGSAYEKAFLGPAPADPYYHAPKEVTLDLFKAFATGIELVRDQKLGKPLGASPAEAKPKLAAFWRSELTFANAAGNLEGVKAIFAQGGFAQVVAQEFGGRRELDPVRPRSRHHGLERHRSADRDCRHRRGHAWQARGTARRPEKRGPNRRRHDLARAPISPSGSTPWMATSHGPRPPYVSAQPCLECSHAGPAWRRGGRARG